METEKVKYKTRNGDYIMEDTYIQEKTFPKLKRTWKWWKKNKVWITEVPKKRKLIQRKVFIVSKKGKALLVSDNTIENGGIVVRV